jgi:hypothetical protein
MSDRRYRALARRDEVAAVETVTGKGGGKRGAKPAAA